MAEMRVLRILFLCQMVDIQVDRPPVLKLEIQTWRSQYWEDRCTFLANPEKQSFRLDLYIEIEYLGYLRHAAMSHLVAFSPLRVYLFHSVHDLQLTRV